MAISLGREQGLRVVEIALTLALVLLLVKIAMVFMPAGQKAIPATPIAISAPTGEATGVLDTSILASFDPFHRESTAVVAGPVQESAPETTLNLRVFGMRADLLGDTSSAIIQTPDQKQATYFIGDEIIEGVTLKSVDIDYVILDRNGVFERLSRQGRTEEETSAGLTLTPSTMTFKASSMINDLRFFPHREGRRVIGYKVMARRGGALDEYGFKRNDIITSINGEDLTQTRVNLPRMFKNLRLARYASIQIIRDDIPMTIEVNLQ